MMLIDILTRAQKESGLTVYDDEDMVYLSYGDKVIAVWSALTASRSLIQFEAQIYLDQLVPVRQVDNRTLAKTDAVRDFAAL